MTPHSGTIHLTKGHTQIFLQPNIFKILKVQKDAIRMVLNTVTALDV